MAGGLPEPDPARVEECLGALVACRTENPPGDEAAPARLLAERLEPAGFEITLQEVAAGRLNLVASLGDARAPCLALNSHLDTVPAGPGWLGDPFRLRAEGDRLIGRGACDAKGPVAAMAEAVRHLGDGALDALRFGHVRRDRDGLAADIPDRRDVGLEPVRAPRSRPRPCPTRRGG